MLCRRGDGFAALGSRPGRSGVVAGALTGVLESGCAVLAAAGERVVDGLASFGPAAFLLLLLLLSLLLPLPSSLFGFFGGSAPSEKEKAEEEIGATLFPFPLSGGRIFAGRASSLVLGGRELFLELVFSRHDRG